MGWSSALPLLLVTALIVFEERVSVPNCEIVTADGRDLDGATDGPDDLKVMVVADLLLMGSDASYANIYFRDSYTTKFFRVNLIQLRFRVFSCLVFRFIPLVFESTPSFIHNWIEFRACLFALDRN